MSDAHPLSRFTRLNQVRSSFHDYLCYLALEQSTGLQFFWYEFVNNSFTPEEESVRYRRLVDAQQIQSPFLLRIIHVVSQDCPRKFIVVTEALQSPSLAEYIHLIKTPPPLRTCIRWFQSLCEGVHALHQIHLFHGAISVYTAFIKPATGALKLKLPLTSLSGRSISPSALDFDQFTAPELLFGVKSQKNDIWSLGIVLLEMITGLQAYSENKTPNDLILALVNGKKPQALEEMEDGIVKEFIGACLLPADERPTVEDLLAHPIHRWPS